MAMQQKETPDVAPTVGYTRKHYTGVEVEPLARGIQSAGRGIYDIGNIRDAQEDVSALIEEGLIEFRQEEEDYKHTKGVNAANPEEYKKFQERMYKILTHRMQGAKTAKGRLEVRNALNRHRTLIESRSYEWHKNMVDAQETASANAELQHFVKSATETDNILVINEGLAGVEDVAKRDAARLGFDEHQTTAYVNQALSAAIISIMNGAVIKGDYEEAKEKEELLRELYSHLMETKEERESGEPSGMDAVGVKHGSSALGKKVHEMVDSLRRRETAFELVTKRLAGKGSGLGIQRSLKLQEQLMNNDKGVQDLIRKAEQDGVSREELLSVAKQQVADRIKLTEEQADTWRAGYESIWTQQEEAGALDWETGKFTVEIDGAEQIFNSPKDYHKHLKERADQGDEAAAQAQKVMWERWHPGELVGSGRIVWQEANFLKYESGVLKSGKEIGDSVIDEVRRRQLSGEFPPDALKRIREDIVRLRNENKELTRPGPNTAKAIIRQQLKHSMAAWTPDQIDFVFGKAKEKNGLTDDFDRPDLHSIINGVMMEVEASPNTYTTFDIQEKVNERVNKLMADNLAQFANRFHLFREWGYKEKIPTAEEGDAAAAQRTLWMVQKETLYIPETTNGKTVWRVKTQGELEYDARTKGFLGTPQYERAQKMRADAQIHNLSASEYIKKLNESRIGQFQALSKARELTSPPKSTSNANLTGEFRRGRQAIPQTTSEAGSSAAPARPANTVPYTNNVGGWGNQ